MDDLITLISQYDFASVCVILILAFVAIKQVWESATWVKNKLQNYHKTQNQIEDEKESLENRISKLEDHDKWQYKKLNEIVNSVDEIKNTLAEMQRNQDNITVATSRSALYRLHGELMEQGYLTAIQYETFKALSDEYLKANGNHTMANKLIPEVLALPIKD